MSKDNGTDDFDTNPTTQEHHTLANQLMRDLEFKWNDEEQRWYLNTNWQTQEFAVNAVKRLLGNPNV